jgi:plastocyanin
MRRALPVLIALAVTLAGCGDEGESGSKGTVTVERGQPVRVKAYEYGFEPGTITVRGGGGGPIRFELSNDGSLPHDLHVRKGDDELGGTEAIGDGQDASASVAVPPGEYQIYCSIGDHADLGMTGKLTVE